MSDATKLNGDALRARVNQDMEDSLDEELEMEIDDDRLDKLLAETAGHEEHETLDRKVYFKELFRLQGELVKLQDWVQHEKLKIVVIFEGRDSAGKGGVIKRITQRLNPRICRVAALPAPNERERTQWYFQRYVAHLPAGGEIVLFDRSWYNRAMVEPVFGFCTEEEYQNFMRGVTGFEKDLIRQGTVLVKLYFSVSQEEQARRFARRHDDPLRQWKFSEIDMQAQDHWDEFTDRKYEMLRRTSTLTAPWVIVRAEDKQRARLNAIKVILNAVDYEGRSPDLDFVPDPEIVISGPQEIMLMEAQRIRGGRFTD